MKLDMKLQTPPKVVATPLFLLTNNYFYSFPSILFLIQNPPPQNIVVYKKELYETTPNTRWMLSG